MCVELLMHNRMIDRVAHSSLTTAQTTGVRRTCRRRKVRKVEVAAEVLLVWAVAAVMIMVDHEAVWMISQ